MKKRRIISAALGSALVLSLLGGCAPASEGYSQQNSEPTESAQVHQAEFETTEEYAGNDAVTISLNGTTAQADGDGCLIDGSTITITSKGTYTLKGSLEGQIVVDADGEKVNLVLDGADITCPDSSPLYIKDGKLITITLAEGSQNTLTDGAQYIYDDAEKEEPNAALFSKADLVLEGEGSLTVNANFNNGIQSKDSLEIHSGAYTVNSANHGITGKDWLAVKDGNFTIVSGGDGMRSNNSDDSEVGWISILGGTYNINAGQDGIQAETTLHIGGGEFSITTGGGSANSSTDNPDWGNWGQGNYLSPDFGGWGNFGFGWEDSSGADSGDGTSAKGFKAGADMKIENGVLVIDSSDDAIHSNGSLSITGGTIDINSGDDGIHADSELSISGGIIGVARSYEGIEGVSVNISGGAINITASDDGINSAGGSDGESDRPGANMFAVDENCSITISGGAVTVDASGDGIDSNGNLYISGGTLVVNGPTNNGNGSFDYAGEYVINGGVAAVAGSSGMAQGASSSSSQANMLLCFNGTVQGGTLISLTDQNGNVVLAFTPTKDYSSVFVSCPAFAVGDSFRLWLGGTCSGQSENGVYTGGLLQDAAEAAEVTISQVSTNYGGGGFGGHGGPGGPGGFGKPPGGFGGPGGRTS